MTGFGLGSGETGSCRVHTGGLGAEERVATWSRLRSSGSPDEGLRGRQTSGRGWWTKRQDATLPGRTKLTRKGRAPGPGRRGAVGPHQSLRDKRPGRVWKS